MAEVKQPSHFNRPSVYFQLIPHGRAEAILLTHYYCDSFVHTKMNWGKRDVYAFITGLCTKSQLTIDRCSSSPFKTNVLFASL